MWQKAWERYHNGCGKEKAAEYFLNNQERWQEPSINQRLI